MKQILSIAIIMLSILSSQAQSRIIEPDIVKIVNHLTNRWDEDAIKLETYDGFRKFCHTKNFRNNTIKLLNKIHRYDTVLYNTVTAKYEASQDPEVALTLEDISIVEVEYTTKAFLNFLHKECNDINNLDRNYSNNTDPEFLKEKQDIEDELVKYVKVITQRIDNINGHAHHLPRLSERE